MSNLAKSYIARIDNKKRVTIRGAEYQYYDVKEFDNGCIVLEPMELKVPDTISAKTLKDMEVAVGNIKAGKVSPVIDLSDF